MIILLCVIGLLQQREERVSDHSGRSFSRDYIKSVVSKRYRELAKEN